eukprot:305153-Prymnesium_polylepis.2
MAREARRSLSLGTTTTPSEAMISTPSHLHQVPRVRFSGIAIIRPMSLVNCRQMRNARRARSTPTTTKMGSSVYM